jgi:hypothetical protein
MRIRTLKPEWLEDEKLGACNDEARLLSAGLILLADDQGRGRASLPYLASQVWTYHPRESLAKVSKALDQLSKMQFVILYSVNGEQLFQIRNWAKHQKVDHPAKPRLPGPEQADSRESRESLAKVPETLAPHTSDPDPDPDQGSPTRKRIAEGFNRFWKIYPKKRARGDALKAWGTLKPSAELVGTILTAVEQHRLTEDWQRENGRFIPYPATWLRGRRWEDQLATGAVGPGRQSSGDGSGRPLANAEVRRLQELEVEISRERKAPAGDGGPR